MESRYMIWNDVVKEFQFASICETTEKGAMTCLKNIIGNDINKNRFVTRKVTKEESIQIKKRLKDKRQAEKLHYLLPNLTMEEMYQLIDLNERRK